jgi:hypothetical protein
MTVQTVSDEPTTFDGDNQTVINKEGPGVSSDTEAGIYLDDSSTFHRSILGQADRKNRLRHHPEGSKPPKLLLRSGV